MMTSLYFHNVSGSVRAVHTVRTVSVARFVGVPGWRPVVWPWRAVIPSSPPAEPDRPDVRKEKSDPGIPDPPPDSVWPTVDNPTPEVVREPVREPPPARSAIIGLTAVRGRAAMPVGMWSACKHDVAPVGEHG